ncbi:hypothetical protein JYU19_00225 [bacterium AH-315-J21]|nr:hypothetical protein [bacterium AH-315-J21]
MFLTWLLMTNLALSQAPKEVGPSSGADSIKPEKAAVVTMTNPQQTTFSLFKGDEVFYRADKNWGFKLNLEGFNDLRQKVRGMTIVCFAVREDSIGVTIAHLFVNEFRSGDSLTTPQFYANRLFQKISRDTTIVNSVVTQKRKYGLEILEYDRIEVWPQPVPNSPGMMFDSTLVRHHVNAIATFKKSWIELHLSKTEYRPEDSAVFDDLLKTFEITESFERPKLIPAKLKSVKKQ